MSETEYTVGSTAYQLKAIDARIKHLANEHFKKAPKDLHSKRGMMLMIEKRKKLLKYLKRTEFDLYVSLVKALGIRQKGISSGK